MRSRLYFLLPDARSARSTMRDLLVEQIEARHMHFFAKPGIDLSGLHEANLFQTSDIVHGAEMGLMVGGASGIGIALVAVYYLNGAVSPQLVSLSLPIIGAIIGAWAASMIGASIPNSRLKKFEPALDEGKILLMVDAPRGRREEVRALLEKSHPEAVDRGMEPAMPEFP